MKRETRMLKGAELRVAGTEDQPVITGYAAVFNAPTDIPTWSGANFQEVIMPGAFSRALSEKQDVRGFWNHDDNALPLGRVKSGTLRLSEDDKGLKYEIDAPNTQAARDLVESIKRGDVDGSSFSFRAKTQTWREDGDSVIRELNDVDLMDVSPVNYPAYDATSVSVRSLFPEGAPEEIPEKFRENPAPAESRKPTAESDEDRDFRDRMELRMRLAERL